MRLIILALCLVATRSFGQSSGTVWDWQISTPLNLSMPVAAIDLDPDLVSAADIAALKARGVLTICYISVGTWEDWRNDAGAFPPSIIGNRYDDWPDEAFLDIRRTDILLPLMQARFDRCKGLGFDAIEPDNLDVHENDSGFPLTVDDTIRYVRALADQAHAMGLKIGQKNVGELSDALAPHLDFAVTENCMTDGWCNRMDSYRVANKAIFAAEYDTSARLRARFCDAAAGLGLSLIFKTRDLDASGSRCPPIP